MGSGDPDNSRGTLRRTRFRRVQPGAWGHASRRRQGLPTKFGGARRHARDDQLRKRTPAVHDANRRMLAEKPPRPPSARKRQSELEAVNLRKAIQSVLAMN